MAQDEHDIDEAPQEVPAAKHGRQPKHAKSSDSEFGQMYFDADLSDEGRIDEFRRQYMVNTALTAGVTAVYLVDLAADTFTIERFADGVRQDVKSMAESGISQSTSFSQMIESYCDTFVSKVDHDRIFSELDAETIRERVKREPSYYIEYIVKPNEDEVSYFELHVSAVDEKFGKDMVILSFRCIDDQMQEEIERQKELKRAYAQSREYAKRAQENLDIINDITRTGLWYIEFDAEGGYEHCFWSDIYRNMLGFENEREFPNVLSSWSDRLHPDDKARVLDAYEDAVAGYGEYDEQYRLMRKSGEYGWFHSVGKVLRRGDGTPRLFIGTFVDITEEREKERLHSIISSIASVFFASWSVNLQEDTIEEISVPRYAHPIACGGDVSARIAMENLSRDYTATYEDADKLRDFLNLDTVAERLGDRESIAAEYVSLKRGWCTATIIPSMRDAKGDVIEYVLAIRVIDDEKKSAIKVREALEEAYEAAYRANNAKSDFLSRMSHDIRTPMNAIVGMTAIAWSHLDDVERMKDCLSKIEVSSKHLLRLINEVLDMSKIESGNFSLNVEKFSLSELLDNLIIMARPQIDAAGHTLDLDIYDVRHDFVKGDNQRLEQALMNLLTNAVKYTPEGGTIRMSLTEKPSNSENTGCFEFVIEDNGIGMPDEFKQFLFHPFARARDSRIEEQEGTGLGMPITLNIVRMMNGDVEVESELGAGTKVTVTVFLELQKDGKPSEASDSVFRNGAEALSHRSFAGKRVLLVEDNPLNAEIATEFLEMADVLVEHAINGSRAIDMLEQHEDGYYDMVLMDIQMPVMNGYDATRAIRGHARAALSGIPIVAMTADAFAEDVALARNAGMDEHIAKPIDLEKLLSALSKYL